MGVVKKSQSIGKLGVVSKFQNDTLGWHLRTPTPKLTPVNPRGRFNLPHKLTIRTFCGTGCGVYIETDGKQNTGAYPSWAHPANQGRICVHAVARPANRLTNLLTKKDGPFQPASRDEACRSYRIRTFGMDRRRPVIRCRNPKDP